LGDRVQKEVFLLLARENPTPRPVGHAILILEVYRWNTTTHHSP